MTKNRDSQLIDLSAETSGLERGGRAAPGRKHVGKAPSGDGAKPQGGTSEQTDAALVAGELERVLAEAAGIQAAKEALAHAEDIARGCLRDPAVRFALLRLRERAGERDGLMDQWMTLLQDCPGDLRIVRYCASRLVKERHVEDAMALIDKYLPERLDDPIDCLARAELLSDAGAHGESDMLFRYLIKHYDGRDARVGFAKRLNKRGMLVDALASIEPVAHTLPANSKAAALAASLKETCEFFRRHDPDSLRSGEDIRIAAMKHALMQFRERVQPARPDGHAAKIALVTGSLGPGGAERQLTRLATHLKRISGTRMDRSACTTGEVEVLVKQHSAASPEDRSRRVDFFLSDLRAAEVPVTEINRMKPVAVSHQQIDDEDLKRLLGCLPPQVHYGVTRLAPYLREREIDVISLWQDGTCLFGALAALLAGVPVIHLVFRGLPPNVRRERYRPEYPILFRALSEVPGVEFVTNSQTCANEYAAWLGIPVERFHILYNGVPELSTEGSAQDEAKWREFETRTADAEETIGGVFRLQPEKRPLLWLRLAARYLKRRPRARFFIVGDGRLVEKVEALARDLDIADRLLLVGLSSHVGFWYSKMDVKVLLSRVEGLPNVLIEAQLLGVATVSTPAGGAGECFVNGVNGYLLESLENPDLNQACDRIAELVDTVKAGRGMAEQSRARSRKMFSVPAMLTRFIGLCAASDVPVSETPPRTRTARKGGMPAAVRAAAVSTDHATGF
ncbi:glycosyltransferase [Candidimonas nitroreducens]|uniref:Glycosyl transferase n=1 Tax=Candidimonas nitroreducens TaxID=683354 RepID=A0A225MGR7_9BURK|nr:glycosyltransferase [Candidimonas nitroreducens]OWT60566.1 glycosyl transferase [Candidimonas nitroreducens]